MNNNQTEGALIVPDAADLQAEHQAAEAEKEGYSVAFRIAGQEEQTVVDLELQDWNDLYSRVYGNCLGQWVSIGGTFYNTNHIVEITFYRPLADGESA